MESARLPEPPLEERPQEEGRPQRREDQDRDGDAQDSRSLSVSRTLTSRETSAVDIERLVPLGWGDPRRVLRTSSPGRHRRRVVRERRGAAARRQSPKVSSSRAGPARQTPDRPPVFSQRASSPIVMPRSTDLHMS